MRILKFLPILLIAIVLTSCSEYKAKQTVKDYFSAMSAEKFNKNDVAKIYPEGSKYIEYGNTSEEYKNPKISSVTEQKDGSYKIVCSVPKLCFFVKEDGNGNFIITNSIGLFHMQINNNTKPAAIHLGLVNHSANDIELLHVKKLLDSESEFGKYLLNKYAKYIYDDIHILSVKDHSLRNILAAVQVTYTTGKDLYYHTIYVDVIGKNGNKIGSNSQQEDYMQAGQIRTELIMFNDILPEYVGKYNVNICMDNFTDDIEELFGGTCEIPVQKNEYQKFLKYKKEQQQKK